MKIYLIAVTLIAHPAPGQPPISTDWQEVETLAECNTKRQTMIDRGVTTKQLVWCWTAKPQWT